MLRVGVPENDIDRLARVRDGETDVVEEKLSVKLMEYVAEDDSVSVSDDDNVSVADKEAVRENVLDVVNEIVSLSAFVTEKVSEIVPDLETVTDSLIVRVGTADKESVCDLVNDVLLVIETA
jgi:hypothetical protein